MKKLSLLLPLLLVSNFTLNTECWAGQRSAASQVTAKAAYAGAAKIQQATAELEDDQSQVQFQLQMGTSDLQNAESVEALLEQIAAKIDAAVEDDQSEIQFQIQLGTSDLQNAENVRSQSQSRLDVFELQNGRDVQEALDKVAAKIDEAVEDDQSEIQFQIQLGTSDLQNAENVRSQAEKRLEDQRKNLISNWAG